MVLVFIVNVPFLALAVIAELEELRFRVLILIICRNAGVEGNLHLIVHRPRRPCHRVPV